MAWWSVGVIVDSTLGSFVVLRPLILEDEVGFVAIETPPMTCQYLSIQSFALSATVWQD